LAVSADVADDQHRSRTACGRAAASVGVTGTIGTIGTTSAITAISATERKHRRPDRSAWPCRACAPEYAGRGQRRR
jgi:hypothetical protein